VTKHFGLSNCMLRTTPEARARKIVVRLLESHASVRLSLLALNGGIAASLALKRATAVFCAR
jgi:hypothetical protein